MPFYVTDPDSPGKHIDVIELQHRNPYKTMPPVLITDWLKHDLWTRIQAIQLLAGYIPDNQLSITNPKRYLDGTSDVQLSPLIHPIRDEILSNIMTLSNWAGLSEANETKPPQEWLSWAKEKGFTPYWLDYAKANQSAPTTKGEAGTKQQRQRQRQDALAVELDEILSRIKTRTPANVMAMLREKIGKPNTCVLRNVGDGIEWENDRGDVKTLTISNLGGRIREWKKTGLSQG